MTITTAILDINDQSLMITTDLERSFSECGFAQLSNKGITCGADAYAMHWQVPQSSFNDYWRRLNQLPLPNKQQWARHNADIAFAQLQQMLLAAGSPERLILSVPASFSDPQLALLVGLLNATSTTLLGVIDSGLLAALAITEDSWIVELQLHQTVLSLVRYEHSNGQTNLSVGQQEIIADLGILQIHNTIAKHISDRLIKQYRYDPLHSSSGEQDIYNKMAGWLSGLVTHGEIIIMVRSPSGDLSLTLYKDEIIALLKRRLGHLDRVLSTSSDTSIVFAESAHLISLIAPAYAGNDTIKSVDAAINCLKIAPTIFAETDEPVRVSSLKLASTSVPTKAQEFESKASIATHILYDGQAWSLIEPLSINISEGRLELENGINKTATVCIKIIDNCLQILHQLHTLKVVLPSKCNVNKTLLIGEYRLVLIEVIHG